MLSFQLYSLGSVTDGTVSPQRQSIPSESPPVNEQEV